MSLFDTSGVGSKSFAKSIDPVRYRYPEKARASPSPCRAHDERVEGVWRASLENTASHRAGYHHTPE
jgi:hypothetical protein